MNILGRFLKKVKDSLFAVVMLDRYAKHTKAIQTTATDATILASIFSQR